MRSFQTITGAAFAVVLGAGALGSSAHAQGADATATGISRAFNPAISVNTLFLGSGFPGLAEGLDATDEALESGLRHQESEVQFSSDIDPFTSADLLFSFEEGAFDLEEGYVRTNVLPWGLGLRAGKMLVPIGRENTLHTHQLPFVQKSLAGDDLFGEGLGEFGAELSWIAPLDTYLELRGAVYNGDDARLFAGAGDWDLAYLGGASALWDLGPAATLSLAGDYLAGPNAAGAGGDTRWTQVFATVLRYKWRPVQAARYKAFELLAEFLYADRAADPAAGPGDLPTVDRGVQVQANARIRRRWYLQGRYDLLDADRVRGTAQRGSAVIAYVPSEFSALRLQTSVVSDAADDYAEILLQYNFTIGSHPAHKY